MKSVQLHKKYKRVIQIELNEISRSIVDTLIAKGELPNFAKMNKQWRYIETVSEQKYEHIEPWIQWITAHTGKTFAEHGVFRLSDAVNLGHPQIWETLSDYKVESCILGSMNAVRGDAQGGLFFPDPWSKEGKAYPAAIQPLWNLISKKVQTHATQPIMKKDIVKALQACLRFRIPVSLYAKIARQMLKQKINAKNKWRLAGLFDLFLFQIFKCLVKKNDHQFYTLFLNANAHYQHHFWRNFQPELFNDAIQAPDCLPQHDPITFGYKIYDKVIGYILKLAKDPNTLIIVSSAFSQEPFLKEEANGGMNYYRLYDHQAFAEHLNLDYDRVLPMMSRDWQLEVNNPTQLQQTQTFLSGLQVNGDALFNVSQNSHNSLFIETAVTRGSQQDEKIMDAQGHVIGDFHQFFHNTAVKSGSHVSEGSLWISESFKQACANDEYQQMPLTEIYNLTLDNFKNKEVTF